MAGAEMLTPAEVAGMLRLSVKTLANWRALGEGPKYVKAGRIRYRSRDVAAYLDARTHRGD